MKFAWRLLTLFMVGLLLFTAAQPALAQDSSSDGVVRAVLFYSPSCGHCQQVITTVLPPLFEQYGDQIQMIGVDISSESGSALFLLVKQHFGLESGGVPFLVIGDNYLIGSLDIPEQFPGLIESYLAQGGVDWPDIPGIDQVVESAYQQASATAPTAPAATTTVPETEAPVVPEASPQAEAVSSPEELLAGAAHYDLGERLAQDPAGNVLAVVVLAGMLALAVWSVFYLRRPKTVARSYARGWMIPVLCLVGLFVAGYLAFVETTQTEAVCGPVGDCNTVQQSPYATLFGLLPIGMLGMAGYLAILTAWAVGRYGKQKQSPLAYAAMLGFTGFGLLFSIYLTFLEPFVIGASCAWCLTSAIIMSALYWLSLPDGKRALKVLFGAKKQRAA
jgi:uncharacterized membrane protein